MLMAVARIAQAASIGLADAGFRLAGEGPSQQCWLLAILPGSPQSHSRQVHQRTHDGAVACLKKAVFLSCLLAACAQQLRLPCSCWRLSLLDRCCTQSCNPACCHVPMCLGTQLLVQQLLLQSLQCRQWNVSASTAKCQAWKGSMHVQDH